MGSMVRDCSLENSKAVDCVLAGHPILRMAVATTHQKI